MKVVLFLLSLTVSLKSSCVLAKTLEFFIAAVETKWEYVFTDTADPTANQRWAFILLCTQNNMLFNYCYPERFIIHPLCSFVTQCSQNTTEYTGIGPSSIMSSVSYYKKKTALRKRLVFSLVDMDSVQQASKAKTLRAVQISIMLPSCIVK